jgi:hypothetical protein
MPNPPVFEYAVVRVVPRVEREEFLNVGIVLFCKEQKFLRMKFALNRTRLRAIFPESDAELLEENLKAFQHIAEGTEPNSPISQLDPASRFRWLTATRSTMIQSSKVHPGLCTGPADETLNRLFEELVG